MVASAVAAAVPRVTLTNVPGFFAQDLEETDPASFDYISSNFGLLDECLKKSLDSRKPWEAFKAAIASMNDEAPAGTSYRVLFLARHGQGFHNAAEEYFGTVLWETYWSRLDGNGTSVWADSELTDQGKQEARYANGAWKTQIERGAPLPQSYYSSPLQRSANTLNITWCDITLDKPNPPRPVIKENFRETMGVHTCDRRSSRTFITKTFPNFDIEDGFTENDELWDADVRESDEKRNQRLAEVLKEVVVNDDSTYIAISVHSGVIMSILEVIGHRPFKLQTGGVIPVVVKVEKATHRL